MGGLDMVDGGPDLAGDKTWQWTISGQENINIIYIGKQCPRLDKDKKQ